MQSRALSPSQTRARQRLAGTECGYCLTITWWVMPCSNCSIHHCWKQSDKQIQKTISRNIKWNRYSHVLLLRIKLGPDAHLDLIGSDGTAQTETCLIPKDWIISFQNATYVPQGENATWYSLINISSMQLFAFPKMLLLLKRNPHDLV